jgi:cytochrome c oxidase assembly factor CtaG
VDPLPALPVAAGGVAYAMRTRTLRARGRPVPRAKQAWFWCGVAVLLVAVALPDKPFGTHMAQHLLLGDIGPLLVVLGLTGALLRPVLAVPGLRRLRVLAHPLVALPLWAIAFVVWHLNGPYEAALDNGLVHAAEHFSFFVAGAAMWAAVVEPLPGPTWFGTEAKALYVLAVRAIGMGIASFFIWGDPDKRTGGLIKFTEGGIVTLVAFAWLFLRWTREAEVRQQLIEQGHDPARARRTARHWPQLQQPPGPPRSARSRATRGRPSE